MVRECRKRSLWLYEMDGDKIEAIGTGLWDRFGVTQSLSCRPDWHSRAEATGHDACRPALGGATGEERATTGHLMAGHSTHQRVASWRAINLYVAGVCLT